MADAPYNAADAKQVKKRTDKAKLAADQRDDEFKQLLEQPAFRRFLWNHICVRCQVFQSPFNPNGSVQTLNVGRQDVGRELFADVERVNPTLIPQMMTEHAEARRSE
jgi:hypothetical protein